MGPIKCKRDATKKPVWLPENPIWWEGVEAAKAGITNPDARRGLIFLEGWIVGKLYPNQLQFVQRPDSLCTH